MKLSSVIMAFALSSITLITQAQTKPAIADEDLKKYALTLDSIKVMQETLGQIGAENVQKNTVMTVARYNELFKIAPDETKLTAANAKPEEVAFVKEIADLRAYNIDRINSTYQALAKDYVGLKTFNTIKKSLDSDQNLKARFESISQEIESSKQPGNTKG